MRVHPASISAAQHGYRLANGGREFPLNAATVAEIISAVHAVAKKHNRRTEIQRRMKRAALAHELSMVADPLPAPATPQDGEAS